MIRRKLSILAIFKRGGTMLNTKNAPYRAVGRFENRDFPVLTGAVSEVGRTD